MFLAKLELILFFKVGTFYKYETDSNSYFAPKLSSVEPETKNSKIRTVH